MRSPVRPRSRPPSFQALRRLLGRCAVAQVAQLVPEDRKRAQSFDPFQPEIPFISEFGATLGYVFRRVTGPEAPEYFRAFRLLPLCNPETAQNIETAFHVFEPFKNGMQAVAESVRLQEPRRSRLRKVALPFACSILAREQHRSSSLSPPVVLR